MEQGEESYRGEVVYRASDMSGGDFNRVVQACFTMANKKGWKQSRPMRNLVQPVTNKGGWDKAVFICPEELLRDA